MKLTTNKDQLAKNLNLVSRAVGLKPTLPVLNNVLLSLSQGQLRLSATNLETSISLSLPVEQEEAGDITVPARLLTEFVNNLPDSQVSLATKEEKLVVKGGKFEASFAGINASEFPNLTTDGEADKVFFTKELAKAISQTTFAASSDEGRPVLTGLLIEFTKGQVNLVATDGYRLAKKRLMVDASLETKYLVPAKALNEVARLIAEVDADQEISVQTIEAKNQLLFHLGPIQVTTRLLDGTYPPYQSIIPESFKTRAVLPTDDLAQAVKATALFARDLGNVIHLEIDPVAKQVQLSAKTAQVGTGSTSLEAAVEGEKLVVALNSNYLTAGLSALSAKQITIEGNDSNKSVLIRPVGDDNFFYIIMPVRLQS